MTVFDLLGGHGRGYKSSLLRDCVRRGRSPVSRVVIVAEIRLYREGIARCLGEVEGIDVVGSVASWSDVGRLIDQSRPHVLLADMDMPESLPAVRSMTSDRPAVKVVALAVSEMDDVVIGCAEAGVSGYVTRDQSLADLVQAVRGAAKDEAPCSPRIAAALLRHVTALSNRGLPGTGARLTAREAEIVELIDAGFTNREIAEDLCIEVATVKNHVHNILEKLDVRRRTDAAAVLRGNRRDARGRARPGRNRKPRHESGGRWRPRGQGSSSLDPDPSSP
jgi:two-component system nitrate/nitrite response regulator NarL